MWPYFSDDGEKVPKGVYSIENPFHELHQDLSEFSNDARTADHVFEAEVRAKLGASLKQFRADPNRHTEFIEPHPKRSRVPATNLPQNPLRNLTTIRRKHGLFDPNKRMKLPTDLQISSSPLQNLHQNIKSGSAGWNNLRNAKSSSPKSSSNSVQLNPANLQPDYRSSAFKSPAQLQSSGNRFTDTPQIFADPRSATTEMARRPQPSGLRPAFSFAQPSDIRIGANRSGNFQVRTINYNPNPPRPQEIRNSACSLDPRIQNNYSRAQTTPQSAMDDPRMRANRTETDGQRQASTVQRKQESSRDTNKREELQRSSARTHSSSTDRAPVCCDLQITIHCSSFTFCTTATLNKTLSFNFDVDSLVVESSRPVLDWPR